MGFSALIHPIRLLDLLHLFAQCGHHLGNQNCDGDMEEGCENGSVWAPDPRSAGAAPRSLAVGLSSKSVNSAAGRSAPLPAPSKAPSVQHMRGWPIGRAKRLKVHAHCALGVARARMRCVAYRRCSCGTGSCARPQQARHRPCLFYIDDLGGGVDLGPLRRASGRQTLGASSSGAFT